VQSKFRAAYDTIYHRTIKILDDEVAISFSERVSPNCYNLKELGGAITNREDERLANLFSVNKVIYIDTPVILAVSNLQATNIVHWEDLDQLLKTKKPNYIHEKGLIDKLLSDEVLDGETAFDSQTASFVYKRKDGLQIDLLSCATGIKSFAILQILYQSGHLDNKTLLILDEPETHLHPEWIVQYARLVVMLQKVIGVSFLINSHNPDMVMAIKYIAKKELANPKATNFYLAKNNDAYTYNYELSETDIEPIFQSFNASLDKINMYGGTAE